MKKISVLFRFYFILFSLTLLIVNSYSQTTWVGGTPGNTTNWFTNSNWSPGIHPISSTDVVIPTGVSFYPIIDADAACNDLTIQPKASVTINPSVTLTVGNNFVIQSTNAGTGAIWDLGTLTVNGTTTIQQYLSANTGGYYHYISSPMFDGTTSQVTKNISLSFYNAYYTCDYVSTANICSGPNTMYRYDENHTHELLTSDMNGWKFIASGEHFGRMKGYGILNQSNNTINYTGSGAAYSSLFNTGHISLPLTKTAISLDGAHNGSQNLNQYGCTYQLNDPCNNFKHDNVIINNNNNNGSGWNFIGNPYPSPLNWDDVFNNNGLGAISQTIYFFEATNGYTGRYDSYTANGFGTFGATKYIPAMQGFFVKTNSNINLTFENTYRSVDASAMGQGFYKSNKNKSNYPLIRISANLSGYTKWDEMIVYFKTGATVGYDTLYDVLKLMNTDDNIPNIFSLAGKEKLSINALPEIDGSVDTITVPFIVNIWKQGKYILSATQISNIPSGYNVILKDKKLNQIFDLTINPTDTFDIQASDNNSDRFNLLLAKISTGINKHLSSTCNIFSNARNLYVNYNANKASMNIYNIEGKMVGKTEVIKKGNNKFELPYAPGIYIVKVIDNSNVFIEKVYIY